MSYGPESGHKKYDTISTNSLSRQNHLNQGRPLVSLPVKAIIKPPNTMTPATEVNKRMILSVTSLSRPSTEGPKIAMIFPTPSTKPKGGEEFRCV